MNCAFLFMCLFRLNVFVCLFVFCFFLGGGGNRNHVECIIFIIHTWHDLIRIYLVSLSIWSKTSLSLKYWDHWLSGLGFRGWRGEKRKVYLCRMNFLCLTAQKHIRRFIHAKQVLPHNLFLYCTKKHSRPNRGSSIHYYTCINTRGK